MGEVAVHPLWSPPYMGFSPLHTASSHFLKACRHNANKKNYIKNRWNSSLVSRISQVFYSSKLSYKTQKCQSLSILFISVTVEKQPVAHNWKNLTQTSAKLSMCPMSHEKCVVVYFPAETQLLCLYLPGLVLFHSVFRLQLWREG